MRSGGLYVVISGPPGSGKSTLAAGLAPRLGLPLIAKDTIKHALMNVLPVPDVAASKELGRASVLAMLAVATDCGCGVLESVWHRSRAVEQIAALPGRVVEVFCRLDRQALRERYRLRAGTRHQGHFDDLRTEASLWNDDTAVAVAGGWPVLEVDTAHPVDPDQLVGRVVELGGGTTDGHQP